MMSINTRGPKIVSQLTSAILMLCLNESALAKDKFEPLLCPRLSLGFRVTEDRMVVVQGTLKKYIIRTSNTDPQFFELFDFNTKKRISESVIPGLLNNPTRSITLLPSTGNDRFVIYLDDDAPYDFNYYRYVLPAFNSKDSLAARLASDLPLLFPFRSRYLSEGTIARATGPTGQELYVIYKPLGREAMLSFEGEQHVLMLDRNRREIFPHDLISGDDGYLSLEGGGQIQMTWFDDDRVFLLKK